MLSVVIGLVLATLAAYQGAALAAFEVWADGVPVEPATAYAALLIAGVTLGAGSLVAAGVETLRGASWAGRSLVAAVLVTAIGWGSIPLLAQPLRAILDEDAGDPVRFRHSLHFSGDLEGDLTNARFLLTIAGRERTCGRRGNAFSLWQLGGSVGGREVKLWIAITPYDGSAAYRARHEYGPGVAGPGEAGFVVELEGYRVWYPMSGTITVNPDERSGSIDAVAAPLPTERFAPKGQTRITGSWSCLGPTRAAATP